VATDITASDIAEFIASLPRDRVSDLPIRVVEVTGDYRIGVFGVFRPQQFPGGSNLHPVDTTEIYYILQGNAVLVTGGVMTEPYPAPSPSLSVRGTGIEGGVSRRIGPGDVVIIPGHTPHWFSSLETDLTYLIYRPDPDNRLTLK
jgi:mannose-6-phosphate isomerase-like protein (cupin superfamily)